MDDIFLQKKRGRKPKNKDNNDLIGNVKDDDIIKKKEVENLQEKFMK